MRLSSSYKILQESAAKRLGRLRAHALVGLGKAGPERDTRFAFVVIEAQNLWANFFRSYTLSCVFSPKRTIHGRVTLENAAISTPGDVLLVAARVHRGSAAGAPTSRRDEPPWHSTNVFLRTCSEIGCSHIADIRNALSVSTRVFDDLPAFRNFYAHRNEESARKAIDVAQRYYVIRGARSPAEALATPPLKRTQALILDWLDDMSVVMQFLCE